MGLIYYGKHYDMFYKENNGPDINFWIKQVNNYGGHILELACGTGRITIPIAKEGKKVTGIDISKSMIEQARMKAKKEKVDNIEWVVSDIRNFDLNEKFSFIFIPANSLSHLLTLSDVEDCFSNVKKHLSTNGKFIIDIFNPRLEILSRKPEDRYPHGKYKDPESNEIITVMESSNYDTATQINHIKLYYSFPEKKEEVTEELNLRIFFPQEIDALLKYNGFKINEKYGDYEESSFRSTSQKQIIICSHAFQDQEIFRT